MPFPWKKKSRVTRISQIVADLQSPKRGGSLVVQTGFPTSLIDLFVKNRSRFARPKPKKPGRPEDIPDPPPPPPSPATSPPPPIPTLPPRPEAPTPGPLIRQENADTDVDSGRVIECRSGSGNREVGDVVRIFMVLVLIASLERLTVGITVSAFALLFLEYAAKRSVSCSRPCARFQKLLLLQLKLKKKKKEEEEESEPANFQGELSELRSGSSRAFDEIEVVETNIEESCGVVAHELGLVGGDVAWGSSELVEEVDDDDADSSKGKVVVEVSSSSREVFYECKASRGSRGNFRFKSKMVKKLVPKKFRGSKKEKKVEKMGEAESGSEVSTSSAVEEDKPMSFEIEEETRNVGKIELECIRDDGDDDDDDVDEVDCGITGSQELSLVMEVVDVYNEGKRIGRVGNSGYIVLLVIALAGLLVGRFQALILTMAWCLMLKVVKTLWRTLDVPWL